MRRALSILARRADRIAEVVTDIVTLGALFACLIAGLWIAEGLGLWGAW